MRKSNKTITAALPRENSGRDTGLRFDYQYRQAAEAALEILEGKDVICVYCDYQDDYVVHRKTKGADSFDFVQVKSKKDQKHQWKVSEVFGVNEQKKTPKSKPLNSFAGKLLYHEIHFDKSCRSVSVLTNVFFVDDIELLIKDVSAAKSIKNLKGKSKTWFDKISDAYTNAFENIDTNIVFAFLKKMKLRDNAGPLVDEKKDHAAIFLKRIYEYSEITLTHPETLNIYSDLIELVRKKSIAEIPFNIKEHDLKKCAGITLQDLLSVLSISQSGYEILKNGGDPKALINTSRLERFIISCKGNQDMVDTACAAKVAWDNWFRTNRHVISNLDLSNITSKCLALISSHNATRRDLAQLSKEIEAIANTFIGKTSHPFTKDLVFGLFLNLVAKGAE